MSSHARRRAASPLRRTTVAVLSATAVIASLAGCLPAAGAPAAQAPTAATTSPQPAAVPPVTTPAPVPTTPAEVPPPPAPTPAPEPAPVEEEAPVAEADTEAPAAEEQVAGSAAGLAPAEAAPPPVLSQPGAVPAAGWFSGASGYGTVNGSFGNWRGRPLEIAGTWADNNNDQVGLWTLDEWRDFDGPVDIAIGAIGPGETWAAAAQGAYDARWRQSLINLEAKRGDRGTVYIRFAHEMNGNWYPWSVDASEVTAFRQAWQRFRALQQQVFPESRLVFNVNRESVGAGVDWRQMFPGQGQVDVMSVDYYNQWPAVSTAAEWAASMDDVDQWGAPKGLEMHRRFAESQGLPLAISEWSGNADFTDTAAFMQGMYDFFRTHAGTGAGDLLYEVLFNVDGYDLKFWLFGNGTVRLAQSAAAYQRLW
ncbi:glycosyl hydrolase [Geodermatophilus nigrescens]|uniref:Glycosyl hydrolase family 26 n=1 Tax=Geodermatophilus nigrescens TaxID=1070870 RepID=A0A1M5D6H5_9ACTN|nr:glycosyl hydrolase [Geodermatophilus nigrescens]SHF62455.1 Glycosyl hydrolase family 26 [Geodermatophilus nigrescens]